MVGTPVAESSDFKDKANLPPRTFYSGDAEKLFARDIGTEIRNGLAEGKDQERLEAQQRHNEVVQRIGETNDLLRQLLLGNVQPQGQFVGPFPGPQGLDIPPPRGPPHGPPPPSHQQPPGQPYVPQNQPAIGPPPGSQHSSRGFSPPGPNPERQPFVEHQPPYERQPFVEHQPPYIQQPYTERPRYEQHRPFVEHQQNDRQRSLPRQDARPMVSRTTPFPDETDPQRDTTPARGFLREYTPAYQPEPATVGGLFNKSWGENPPNLAARTRKIRITGYISWSCTT
jgi:hypothetical protein